MRCMQAAARPGLFRTDFSFDRLRKAHVLVEDPSRPPTMLGEIGQDEELSKIESNIRSAALICYFISSNYGDVAGTGVALCYSGTKISFRIEHYVQPPIALTGWKMDAFLDMCESTAEFLHRAKFYYNDAEYPTQVMLTLVRLDGEKMLSVDSDFETRETREGDHCYTVRSNDTVLGSSRPEDIINGPELSGELGSSWLELYLLSKLAWRLDMLGLQIEYDLVGSCRVISVLYHFLPVFSHLAMNEKFTAFACDGFNLSGEVNGSAISITSAGIPGEGLDVKNRVMSMGFSAVLAMWCSWLSTPNTSIQRQGGQGKLHQELIFLMNMKDFNIRTKMDNLEACLSLLLATAFSDSEYYKERVQLYSDVLLRDELKQSISVLYQTNIPKDLAEAFTDPTTDDSEYTHFAGVTHGLPMHRESISGELCVSKKGWSPEPCCATRKMIKRFGVRVTVEDGKLKSSKGWEIFSNALRCISGVTVFGCGVNMNYQNRHYHTAQDAIANGLLSGFFTPGAALWMLNLLSEGLVAVNRSNSNCIAECAAKVDSDGVKITVPLPPKVTNKLRYITEGSRLLTMVNESRKGVEVSTNASGTYQWHAVDKVDVQGMRQFKIVHRNSTG